MADAHMHPSELLCTEWGYWGDRYVGTAEALIAAGLVTADQLPGQPGGNKMMCTFYDGAPVKKGASNHERNEKYLSIRRVGNRFEVFKGVTAQVGQERRAAGAAQRAQEARADADDAMRSLYAGITGDKFREWCLRDMRIFRRNLVHEGDCPFRFPADAQAEMQEALSLIEEIIRTSEVLPLRTEPASAGRHLRLAWSAP